MVIKSIKKHLKIYWKLVKLAAIHDMTYRASFFLKILVEALYIFVLFFGMRVIYWNVNQVAGWDFNQLLVLIGVYSIFSEIIFGLVFVMNLRTLPEKIANGGLDFILTRPINSQFIATLRQPYFAFLPSLLPGIVSIIAGFTRGAFSLNIIMIPPALLLFICGLVCAYSLATMLTTLSFWLINASALPEIAENLIYLADKPYSVFAGLWRIIFLLIVPLAFMSTFPTDTLLGNLTWWWLPLGAFLATIFLYGSHKFWRLGLKHYQSASS